MKSLMAIALALPLSSFAAEFAACDLLEFKYDVTNNLVHSQRVSNTWEKLGAKNEVLLEDVTAGAAYSVKFDARGYITGSLALAANTARKPGSTVFTSNRVDLNQALDLNLEYRDLKGQKVVYNLVCSLDF